MRWTAAPAEPVSRRASGSDMETRRGRRKARSKRWPYGCARGARPTRRGARGGRRGGLWRTCGGRGGHGRPKSSSFERWWRRPRGSASGRAPRACAWQTRREDRAQDRAGGGRGAHTLLARRLGSKQRGLIRVRWAAHLARPSGDAVASSRVGYARSCCRILVERVALTAPAAPELAARPARGRALPCRRPSHARSSRHLRAASGPLPAPRACSASQSRSRLRATLLGGRSKIWRSEP